jgi:hypothetical protein
MAAVFVGVQRAVGSDCLQCPAVCSSAKVLEAELPQAVGGGKMVAPRPAEARTAANAFDRHRATGVCSLIQ